MHEQCRSASESQLVERPTAFCVVLQFRALRLLWMSFMHRLMTATDERVHITLAGT